MKRVRLYVHALSSKLYQPNSLIDNLCGPETFLVLEAWSNDLNGTRCAINFIWIVYILLARVDKENVFTYNLAELCHRFPLAPDQALSTPFQTE